MRGLLKEHRFLPEYFANVDGDFLKVTRLAGYMHDLVGLNSTYQFLSGKDRVHDRDVRRREVGRDGKDQNAGISSGGRCLVDQASGWWMSETVDD